MIWFFQLHDTIKMKSNHTQKDKNVWFFQLSFVNPQRAKDGTHMFDAKYRYVFVV